MERWTTLVPAAGCFRMQINHGGRPFWCMFDFAVLPAPGTDSVEIVLAADADPESAAWFTHLRTGMLRGLSATREQGREWVGGRVEVRKVYTHPVDTTAYGCERYGFEFVLDELPRLGRPIVGDDQPGA